MLLTVNNNQNLTPDSDIKSVYYLTFQAEQSLDYLPGDWLTIKANNPPKLVDQLLQQLRLDGTEEIELRRIGKVSSYQALSQHLEITQLNPAILNKLQRQLKLGEWADRQAMMDYAYGRDILDLLALFPSLLQQPMEFLALLAPLAPRYYSIASAALGENSNQVSILFKVVDYAFDGRQRVGVTTNFLRHCEVGQTVEVEFKDNPTFKVPPADNTPIIMIGAGTGLAPFIGFMQHRAANVCLDKPSGSVNSWLFFGEVSSQQHLFAGELDKWQQQGLLRCDFAFSRDQAEKIYVQHRLLENQAELWQWLQQGGHIYICGNQQLMAEAVKQAWLEIFCQQGAMNTEQALAFWQDLRQQKRLQLDVY